jgi:hypothetical protein
LIDHCARAGGLVVAFAVLLSACGGGGSDPSPAPPRPPVITAFAADRDAYFIGERAQLTASFANGAGHIEPGGTVVQNGQVVLSPMLE